MKLWFHKVSRAGKVGLVPSDEIGQRIVRGMADGECCVVEVVRPRSVPMHRRLFGIARNIGLNQDPQRTEEQIVNELKIRAGHYELMWVDGYQVRVPLSIAFHKLSHDEWMQIWPSLEQAGIERFGAEYFLEENREAAA